MCFKILNIHVYITTYVYNVFSNIYYATNTKKGHSKEQINQQILENVLTFVYNYITAS